MKLLCVGDIHLGRQPARMTPRVLERLNEVPGPALAWRRTVDYAVEQNVDAVLLAGDVVEQEDDFYEAYNDLKAGVEKLTQAGIPVIGVAGNHDVKVLPRLADALPDFHLLGHGGRWESMELPASGPPELCLTGWSFPRERVRNSPLAETPTVHASLPTIGLLHCDRDQPGSPYAPVRSSELEAAPVQAWLLGHIHKPDALAPPRPMGYLGSLSGLDPGEPGPHGPWLLDTAGGDLSIAHIPLAPLRWETLEVPVDGLEDAADIHPRITRAMENLQAALADSSHTPLAVGCRLRLTGRTALRSELEQTLTDQPPADEPLDSGGILFFLHDWRLDALPALDLEELAANADPVGLLARKLLILRGDDSPERRRLIQQALQRFESTVRHQHFRNLNLPPPDEAETANMLEAAALRALDELLARREAAE